MPGRCRGEGSILEVLILTKRQNESTIHHARRDRASQAPFDLRRLGTSLLLLLPESAGGAAEGFVGDCGLGRAGRAGREVWQMIAIM